MSRRMIGENLKGNYSTKELLERPRVEGFGLFRPFFS